MKKIWINNSVNQKMIEADKQIPTGWCAGRLPVSSETKNKLSAIKTGKVHIHLGNISKVVFKDQLDEYLQRGYELGRAKFSDKALQNIRQAREDFFKTNPHWVNQTSFSSDQSPWNKGLTKETDPRIAIMAKHYTEARPAGYHYSEETKLHKAQKERNTKLKNNSFNSSQPEDKLYKELCIIFSEADIERNYNLDKRYPFKCDFYIKSEDLFIELNYTWMHGGHPFDKTSQDDLTKLADWQTKFNLTGSKQYKSAITVWSKSDPLKLKTAVDNKLNYVMLYTEGEANDFIRRIQN